MADKLSLPLMWHNETRKVNELVLFDKNPRKMTEEQIAHLTESLQTFGLVEIPAIDTDGTIVAGHMRTNVLKALGRGEETIDVRVPNRKLTEQEFKEYNVRSNQNRGMWDFELLAGLFDEQELLRIGFSEKELDMVDFPELEDVSFVEETEKATGNTYELVFATEANAEEFVHILQLLKSANPDGASLSDSLLIFLRENVSD